MAQPIVLEMPPRDPRAELRKRLDEAPLAHAEALLDSYELLQQLHDHGVLELMRGGLGASDTLIETAVAAAKTDDSMRAIRNAIILSKMLGAIDPEVLRSVATATADAFGPQRSVESEPPGLFALLMQFRHKELRRSMALVNKFLESLGKQTNSRSNSK